MADENGSVRPVPTAPGGRFGFDAAGLEPVSAAEAAWTRAALEAMHLRVTSVLSAYVEWSRLTGLALAALAEGHHGTASELVEAIDPHAQLARDDGYEAEELFYALVAPDDAHCGVCGATLNMFHGNDGWQHWRPAPDAVFPAPPAVLFTPDDGHEPQVTWRPRLRPAIVDGAVERPVYDGGVRGGPEPGGEG